MPSIHDLLASQKPILPGMVLLGPMSGVDHDKFYIIAGVSGDTICVCTVLINSRIHPFIMRNQHLLDRQVMLKADNYPFLDHDSFVNCAQPVTGTTTAFQTIDFEYKGALLEQDLIIVRQEIINSGMLTEEERQKFFG